MTSAAAAASTGVVPEWTFADRIRKIRRDVLDVEQSEFATRLDVTRQRLAAWESGRTTPRDSVAVAKRIELLSGVPASWLLGLDPMPRDADSVIPASPPVTREPRARHLHAVPSAHVIGAAVEDAA